MGVGNVQGVVDFDVGVWVEPADDRIGPLVTRCLAILHLAGSQTLEVRPSDVKK